MSIYKSRRWLADNASKLIAVVAGFLLLSGAVGYMRGITEAPGKYGKPQPVWLLFVVGLVLLWVAKEARQQKSRPRKPATRRSPASRVMRLNTKKIRGA